MRNKGTTTLWTLAKNLTTLTGVLRFTYPRYCGMEMFAIPLNLSTLHLSLGSIAYITYFSILLIREKFHALQHDLSVDSTEFPDQSSAPITQTQGKIFDFSNEMRRRLLFPSVYAWDIPYNVNTSASISSYQHLSYQMSETTCGRSKKRRNSDLRVFQIQGNSFGSMIYECVEIDAWMIRLASSPDILWSSLAVANKNLDSHP